MNRGGNTESSGMEQAAALRAQAERDGLRFMAYLPPTLAAWLLDQIEDGLFADPLEAMFAIVGIYRDLEPHAAPRDQLVRRAYLAATFDDEPCLPDPDIIGHVQALLAGRLAEPATWPDAGKPLARPG